MVTPQSPNPTASSTEPSSLTPREPVPLRSRDLVPHLRSLARSLRDGTVSPGDSAP